MLDERFVYLTLILNTAGSVHYVIQVVAGRVRPNRASWVLWTIAPAVVFAAELGSGAGLGAVVMTLGITLGPLMVTIAAFTTRVAYWKLGWFDWLCGGLSALAIVLWSVTDSATLAIVLSIAADFVAAVPTIRKAIAHPHTESPFFFVFVSLGGALTLLTIHRWTFADWVFPAYIFLFPGLLAWMIWRLQEAAPEPAFERA